MTQEELMTGLPGETMIREGLADAREGRCTISSCLVAIALPRLRRAGLVESDILPMDVDAELQLYRLLLQEGGDAYSRYNALLRELVSFEHAIDHRISRLKGQGSGVNKPRTAGS